MLTSNCDDLCATRQSAYIKETICVCTGCFARLSGASCGVTICCARHINQVAFVTQTVAGVPRRTICCTASGRLAMDASAVAALLERSEVSESPTVPVHCRRVKCNRVQIVFACRIALSKCRYVM